LGETQISGRYQDSPVASQKCEKPAPILKSREVASWKPDRGGNGSNGHAKCAIPKCEQFAEPGRDHCGHHQPELPGISVCACGSFALHGDGHEVECQTCGSRWGQ